VIIPIEKSIRPYIIIVPDVGTSLSILLADKLGAKDKKKK